MAAPVYTSTAKLSNGHEMPLIGLGAMEAGMRVNEDEKERIIDSIVHALKEGYRLIDTAKVYNTEVYVGEAIRRSGVPRKDITVVTKLYQNDHSQVEKAFESQLATLGLDYLDIYLMHWPCAETPDGQTLGPSESPTFVETWKSMEKLVGPKLKGIGVSNFSQKTLGVLLEEATIKPVVNQIEVHVQYPSFKLVSWCQERDVQIMAWAPIAGGPNSHYTDVANVYDDAYFKSLAEKYDTSIGVILMSWLVGRNIIVIPHSANHNRLSQNLRLVKLNEEETNRVASAHQALGQVRLIDQIKPLWKEDKFSGWTRQDFGWEDEKGNWLL